jgi:predicted amidohydrolase YtcJ
MTTHAVPYDRSMPADAPMTPTLVIRDARLRDRPVDVVVAGDRIAAVVNAGDADPDGVEILDARGGTILPGFVDAHVHLVLAGTTMAQADLSRCPSRAAFERRMADHATITSPDAWILGHGWLETDWQDADGGTLPDASWLAACGDRPVVCFKHDHHAVLVNDVVLAMLGERLRSDPPGGTIVRDAGGRPTGLLLEAAAWQLVNPIIPKPSVELRRRTTIDATRHLASLGITAVGSMEYAEDVVDVLDAIRADLHVAVAVTMLDRELPIDGPLTRLESLDRDDAVRLVGCKAFLDGTLGSRTAAMLADYTDRPGERGMLVELAERGELFDWISFVVRRGWSPSMHAIGDAAARLALDACDHAEQVARDAGLATPRLRIEHCQTIDPADIARFAPSNRYASMQPTHMLDDGTTVEQSLGAERFDAFFPFRAIHGAGGTLSFGSDWPIETPDPIEGMRVAVTGVDRAGRVVPGRDRTVDIDAAISAYTTNARTALGLPEVEVAEGFPADLVILDRDPRTANWRDPAVMPKVQATIRGGRPTHG